MFALTPYKTHYRHAAKQNCDAVVILTFVTM